MRCLSAFWKNMIDVDVECKQVVGTSSWGSILRVSHLSHHTRTHHNCAFSHPPFVFTEFREVSAPLFKQLPYTVAHAALPQSMVLFGVQRLLRCRSHDRCTHFVSCPKLADVTAVSQSDAVSHTHRTVLSAHHRL